ncbi:MAG: T9SS type A sorting domain-containing protein [Saprospiraceae bacterium]|nr:T9SS type A sorting domain-containing protein [Saprospiraceae bacterium]
MRQPIFLNSVFIIFLLLIVNVNSYTQTKIWGVGTSPAVGVAEAEFQAAFVNATVAGNYSTTQWTALTISQDDGSVTPGNAYWVRNLTGLSQGGYATNMNPATSPSLSNGIALFDSDFMDNAGVQGAFGTGVAPSDQKGELISPRIDLTGAMDSALVINFYSYYRPYQMNELSVSISTDDGLTWAATADILALQPSPINTSTEGWVRPMFKTVTAGVANLTQCRIKFTFDGNYYYSLIDDITIEMAPSYDIAIGVPDSDGSTFFSIGDRIRIGNNFYNPLVNLDPTNLSEWFWGAKVVNYGAKDILPADSARIRLSIDFTDDVSGQLTSGVYVDTIWAGMDTLKSDDLAGVGLVDYLRNIDFISTNKDGRYDVTYWVEHNGSDGSADNDTTTMTFYITSDAGTTNSHYLSKARKASSDGKVYSQGIVFPGGSPHAAFEYGSVFYFPKGMTDTITIDSVDFRYYIANAFSGAATQTLLVNIYHFIDGSGGGNANGFVSGVELTQVGIGQATLTGLGTTVSNGTYTVETVSGFQDASVGGPMQPLVDGGFYYISVLNQPSLTGGVASFVFEDVPILGVDRLVYAMNLGMTTTTAPFAPSTLRIIDPTGTENWYAGFTGFDEVPSIGVHLSASPLITGTKTVLNIESALLNIYPNPANNFLNIDVRFDEPTDVQYIITDVSGRVVYYHSSKNISSEIHTVDIEKLPGGVYFVSADSNNGVSTKRFIKR